MEITFFDDSHKRALFITGMTTLCGVISAVIAEYLTSDIPAEDGGSLIGIVPVMILIALQFVLYKLVYREGELEWGGATDYGYVVIMTIGIWFISWTILLTSFNLF